MRHNRLTLVVCVVAVVALTSTVAKAQTDTNQIMGKLGYIVGTELTIKATFQAGKGSSVLVTKVNGKDLPKPELINTHNLDPHTEIPRNTVCRFRGLEITYMITPVIDPATGQYPKQQALSGRHFAFKITEVLAPAGVKVREEKSPNKVPEDIGTNASNLQHRRSLPIMSEWESFCVLE